MATGGGNESKTVTGSDSFLFMSYLDEVEDRVEDLRRRALDLSQERESLLAVLLQLKHDRLTCSVTQGESQEILTNIERLTERCENVEIKIYTPRTPEQESSYALVNTLISELEHMCLVGTSNNYYHQAESYLNACISDGLPKGPVDYKFQGMILGCKLEDQKLVRHRLECLVKGSCHADFVELSFKNKESCADVPSYQQSVSNSSFSQQMNTDSHNGQEQCLNTSTEQPEQHLENTSTEITQNFSKDNSSIHNTS